MPIFMCLRIPPTNGKAGGAACINLRHCYLKINFYEKELKVIEEKINKISEKASEKIKQVVYAEKEVREKKDKAVFLLNDLTVELEDKNKKVQKLTKELSAQMTLIKRLMTSITAIEEVL